MTGHRLIEGYLAAVARRLPGSARERRAVLDELHDGLMSAAARHGDPSAIAPVRAALQEFGDPTVLGIALGDELRTRLVRRSALTILGVLVPVGAAWGAYAAVAGFPSTTVPDSWAAPVFALAVDSVRIAAVIAQCGAVLLVAATSSRRLGSWMRLQQQLVRVVTASLTVCAAAVVVGIATIATPHLHSAVLAGGPTAGLMLAMLLAARRARDHLSTAHPTGHDRHP